MGGVKTALGSVFRTQRVHIGQIAYNSGQSVSIDIPRGLLLKSIKLRLSGSLVIGTANMTSLSSELPLPLLQRIELTADGRKPFFSTDGQMLYRTNQKETSWIGENTAQSSFAITAATYPFVSYLTIDPAALRTLTPIASYLDTRLYDKLSLNITWAALSAWGVVGSAVLSQTGTVVDVEAEYTTEGFDSVMFQKLFITDEIPVTATSSALRLAVPRNGLLQSIHFRCLVDGVTTDTLINNISLRSENSVMHMDHLTWATLQAGNSQEYQLSPGARIPGYAFHELSEHYAIQTALDTSSLNTLDLLFDVTLPGSGTNKLIRVAYTYFEAAGR